LVQRSDNGKYCGWENRNTFFKFEMSVCAQVLSVNGAETSLLIYLQFILTFINSGLFTVE